MVTTATQLEVLPLVSVTVNVTLFGPILLQLNIAGLEEVPLIPQLSVLPLSISVEKTIAVPDASKGTVMFWQLAVGAILSTTFTVTGTTVLFPLKSVTVNVILLLPMLAHVKLDWLNVFEAMPQLSVLLISISATEIVAVPDAFKNAFTEVLAETTGSSVSACTPMVTDSVAVHPSCDVTVTLYVPGANPVIVWVSPPLLQA